MNGSTINYEHLAKEALRSMVKTVLESVVETGLPGDHHFYISFHTTAPGVKISNRISAQYPKEMTIVLQHQFWDLKVEEEHFEVRLSFSNIPELLIIPYSAVKVFFDPSVPYGLQFDQSSRPEAVEDKSNFLEDGWHIPAENSDQNLDEIITPPNFKMDGSSASEADEAKGPQAAPAKFVKPENETDEPLEGAEDDEPRIVEDTQEASLESSDKDRSESEAESDGAQIVSLDAFRKKNS